ncbi:MAG: IS1 family transposase [Actinomycetota bacterium]
MANVLSVEKRSQVVRCLVEGNSIRATVRMTGAAKNTVVKLLADLGSACAKYQDKVMRDLSCERIQCDEIWSFVYAKRARVPEEKQGQFGYGDVYTWVAIDADTRLVVTYLVGERTHADAKFFMQDLASRLAGRVQLTTDAYRGYPPAVVNAFGKNGVDFATVIKIFGRDPLDDDYYKPAECQGEIIRRKSGRPDPKHVSTSYVERNNLTMRMGMRRFTRLTNAFSKKVENLAHAVSLHFMHYNFCKVHQTLKTTPAMRAGLTDHVWTIEEVLGLLANQGPKTGGRRSHGLKPKKLVAERQRIRRAN